MTTTLLLLSLLGCWSVPAAATPADHVACDTGTPPPAPEEPVEPPEAPIPDPEHPTDPTM